MIIVACLHFVVNRLFYLFSKKYAQTKNRVDIHIMMADNGTMRLQSFLRLKKWNLSDLARELGVSRATVAYWTGKRGSIPRRKLFLRLRKLTGGAVDYSDFVDGK